MRSKMFYMKDILKKRTVKMSKFWTEAVRNAKPYIPGEQVDQPNLLKLNTNENHYPPSPNVIKAINKELGDSFRLYPTLSMDSMREAVGKNFKLIRENVCVEDGPVDD